MVALHQEVSLIDQEQVSDYPNYALEERVADGVVHALGISASLIGLGWLAGTGYLGFSTPLQIAIGIYALTVVVLFNCSAMYHLTPLPQLRPLLRRFDQSAIFFKIAGTYTPLVVIVGSAFSYSVLALVWAAALVGAGFKLLTGDRLDRYTVAIYLALGWGSVLLLWPLYNALPVAGATTIVLGGLLYTVGVYFHQAENMKYSNAIWHGFVLSASVMHFVAINLAAGSIIT